MLCTVIRKTNKGDCPIMEKEIVKKLKEIRSKHILNDPEVQLAIEVLKRKGLSLLDIEKVYVYMLKEAEVHELQG